MCQNFEVDPKSWTQNFRGPLHNCRFSHYSPHTTRIKSVIGSSVSIVSFDLLPGCTWRWDISSSPCSECISGSYSYFRL